MVLPGISFAEKEGTFCNTERRVQRVRKVVEPLPGAKPDTWIFTQIMNRMGYEQPELTPAQIMDEISALTPSFGGVSHQRLDSAAVGGRGGGTARMAQGMVTARRADVEAYFSTLKVQEL